MAAGTGNVLYGARCSLAIGGTPVGYGVQVRFSESIMYEAQRVLGSMYVKEWVPQGYDCSATIARVLLVTNPLATNSSVGEDGALTNLIVTGSGPNAATGTAFPAHSATGDEVEFAQNIINTLNADLSITITDIAAPGSNIYRMENCVIAARDVSISQGTTTLEDLVVLGRMLRSG